MADAYSIPIEATIAVSFAHDPCVPHRSIPGPSPLRQVSAACGAPAAFSAARTGALGTPRAPRSI
jgi:hypothetical protein